MIVQPARKTAYALRAIPLHSIVMKNDACPNLNRVRQTRIARAVIASTGFVATKNARRRAWRAAMKKPGHQAAFVHRLRMEWIPNRNVMRLQQTRVRKVNVAVPMGSGTETKSESIAVALAIHAPANGIAAAYRRARASVSRPRAATLRNAWIAATTAVAATVWMAKPALLELRRK